MVVTGAGNVGIGTTSPSAKLHIANESTSGNEFTALRLSNRGGDHASARSIFDFVVQDIDSNTSLGQRKMSIRFRGGYDSGFDATSSDLMMFDGNNKRIGIGTSDPSFNLDLTNAGTIRSGSISLYSDNQKVGTTANTLALFGTNAAGGIGFYTTATTNVADAKMYIMNSGNVGIGTRFPSAKLDVNGSIHVSGNITLNGPDLKIDNSHRRNGASGDNRRALVHNTGDQLFINYHNDYTGNAQGKVMPMSYSDVYNATVKSVKGDMIHNRLPSLNLELKFLINDLIFQGLSVKTKYEQQEQLM